MDEACISGCMPYVLLNSSHWTVPFCRSGCVDPMLIYERVFSSLNNKIYQKTEMALNMELGFLASNYDEGELGNFLRRLLLMVLLWWSPELEEDGRLFSCDERGRDIPQSPVAMVVVVLYWAMKALASTQEEKI